MNRSHHSGQQVRSKDRGSILAKTWTALVPVVALGLASSACEQARDQETVQVYEQAGYEQAWENFKATAHESVGGGFVADGDLYFKSEDDMRAYFDEAMKEPVDKLHKFVRLSTGGNNVIPRHDAVSITYCVSDAFGSNKLLWAGQVKDATKAWEQVANIRFVYDGSSDSSCSSSTPFVDFAVIRLDNAGFYCGVNRLLWNPNVNGCPINSAGTLATGVLMVDTVLDVTGAGAAPFVTQTGVLRHELGHILGLRHEHPWRPGGPNAGCPETIANPAPNDFTGVQVGSTAYDQGSVMHYPWSACGGIATTSLALTPVDRADIQLLYGMNPAWLAVINNGTQ